MKTLRALKITSVLQVIFCLFCVASTVFFGISNYAIRHDSDWRTPFDIANTLIYGWIANPVAPISFVICLVLFLAERKHPENRNLIGRKCVWIFIWPVITTFFYIVALMLTVALTGGV